MNRRELFTLAPAVLGVPFFAHANPSAQRTALHVEQCVREAKLNAASQVRGYPTMAVESADYETGVVLLRATEPVPWLPPTIELRVAGCADVHPGHFQRQMASALHARCWKDYRIRCAAVVIDCSRPPATIYGGTP